MTKKKSKKAPGKKLKAKRAAPKRKKPGAVRKTLRAALSRILVADDISLESSADSRSRAVKTIAGRLAQRLGADLDVVHVEDTTYYPVRDPSFAHLFERYAREQKAKLEDDGLIPDAVAHRSILLSGSPAAKIVELAGKRSSGYELLVLGTQARKGLNRLMVGSVAEEVVRNSALPVMTISPEAQENSARQFEGETLRILVPTGLTRNSDRAEAYAVQLAKRLGAEVILFHSFYDGLHPVVESLFAFPALPSGAAGLVEELRKNAHDALAKKLSSVKKKGVEARAILGDQFQSSDLAVLREAVKQNAALIVMGTHGRSLLSGAFLGRTARGVILGAPVPVVTVRSRAL